MPPPTGLIAKAIKNGQVVSFLGAGASAVYRPDECDWDVRSDFLPTGPELAKCLAKDASFPEPAHEEELPLVASYVEHVQGDRELLNGTLQQAFSGNFTIGSVHRLLASIEPLLIVTTNYDNLIEDAFKEAGKNYHLVVDRGDDHHVWIATNLAKGSPTFSPSKMNSLSKELRPKNISTIYKMHGSIDQKRNELDHVVITEQDYVNLLGRTGTCVPQYFALNLQKSRFLFLGYSLMDWNVRVMLQKLRRIAGTSRESWPKSWAINRNPGVAECEIWDAHNVRIFNYDLQAFIDDLASEMHIEIDR